MESVSTNQKERKAAAILFVIAAAFQLLIVIVNLIMYRVNSGYVPVSLILYVLLYAAVAVGLFLDKVPFPIAGAGFAGLAVMEFLGFVSSVRSVATSLRNMAADGYTVSAFAKITFLLPIVSPVCLMLGFAAAALIIFFTVYGNDKLKQTAKKLAVLPLILLLINCVFCALIVILYAVLVLFTRNGGYPPLLFVQNVLSLAVSILALLGTVKTLNAYLYPEGKPKKTVTRADGTVAEAGDGYCGMAKHVLLLLFTCGIWYYIWICRTTWYTNRVEDEEERSPAKKLLLCMFVPFYIIYWTYKTALRIDKIAKSRGIASDIATPCLVLAIFVSFVPPIIMQDKINAIALNEGVPQEAPEKAPEEASAPVDVPEALEKYKRLLDSGVITQEEFDAKKKQLLDL